MSPKSVPVPHFSPTDSPGRGLTPDHDLTVVIPCFNEVQRLPRTLATLVATLDSWQMDYRVVVVDDGSSDNTCELVAQHGPRCRAIRLPVNRGKGAAVRAGMLAASGAVVAFTDADLPYQLDALRQGYEWLRESSCDVVFGARDLSASCNHVSRSSLRCAASLVFRQLSRRLISRGIVDTQCGLKLFSLPAAKSIFAKSTIDGFVFDVQVAHLTQRQGWRFRKLKVELVNELGSTLSLRRHAWPMLRDLLRWRTGLLCRDVAAGWRRSRIADILPKPPGKPTPAIIEPRRLLLHADDFALNESITDGIVQGFRQGLLTSTSILINAPGADRALAAWRMLLVEQQTGGLPSANARRELQDPLLPFDLGIHLNLTQGYPLTANYPAELRQADGRFCGIWKLYRQLLRQPSPLQAAILAELTAQCKALIARGFHPTHVNGHQYIEMVPAVAEVLPELLARFQLRGLRVATEPGWQRTTWGRGQIVNGLLATVKHHHAKRLGQLADRHSWKYAQAFFGGSHAGRIDLSLVQHFLSQSLERPWAEISLHPAALARKNAESGDAWADPLAEYRPAELRMICSEQLLELARQGQWRLGRWSVLTSQTSSETHPLRAAISA